MPNSDKTGSATSKKRLPHSRTNCPVLLEEYEPKTIFGEILKTKSAISAPIYKPKLSIILSAVDEITSAFK